MIELIPILLLGTLVLVFGARRLLKSWRNNGPQVVTIDDFKRARAALDSVFLETMATKRIFAEEDMEFVSRTGTKDVQRFFLRERKALAVQWLRATGKQIAQLMDLHLKLDTYTEEPSPTFEFSLSVNYFCFKFVSNALLLLLWLRGPFEAVKVINYTLRVAEHFCSVFSVRLDKTNPVKLAPTSSARPL